MKKILAGVLAGASLLAMTVSASAADTKAVKAAGEVEYDVAVTAPKITLDLVLPAKLAAALNPYGADIKLLDDGSVTTDAGIASVAYEIKNNTTDYGIYIDATAVTTVSTADKTKWNVTKVAPVDGTKSAQLALVGADDAQGIADIVTAGIPTANAAFADPTQGVLVMDSTVAADKTTGVAAGQTNQKKFMYLTAAADKDNPATAAMAFVGALAQSKADGTADVEWTEDDSINVALVLKIAAGPKGAVASAPTGPKFAAASDVALAASGGANAVTFTFDPDTTTYTITTDLDATGGRLDLTVNDPSGATSAVAATGVMSYNNTNNRITATGTGTGSITITLTDDADNTKTTTYTINFTIT